MPHHIDSPRLGSAYTSGAAAFMSDSVWSNAKDSVNETRLMPVWTPDVGSAPWPSLYPDSVSGARGVEFR
jgi:hypothetical protein